MVAYNKLFEDYGGDYYADTSPSSSVKTAVTTPVTTPTQSAGVQWALANQGGLDTYNQNIQNWFADPTAHTREQTLAAMAQYGISPEDIQAATGRTLESYYAPAAGALTRAVGLDSAASNNTASTQPVTTPATSSGSGALSTATTAPTLTYHTGKTYDQAQLTALAQQLGSATSQGALQGGVYGEKGANIGFAADQAQKVFGENTNAANQVLLDAAAGLLDKGITDLNQLKSGDVMGNASVRPEYDESGNLTGRYIASWDADEYATQRSRFLTDEEAAQAIANRVYGTEGDVSYQPINIAIGKGIFDANGKQISNSSELQLGATYAGPGGTLYHLTVDPVTNKPAFSTTGVVTNSLGDISGALSILSFVPGIGWVAAAGNALIAASQGNTTGAILNALGAAGGYYSGELNAMTNPSSANAVSGLDLASDVATLGYNPAVQLQTTLADINLAKTAVSGINAIQTGNAAGIVNASLSGYTQLGGTLPSGVTTGVQVANLWKAIDRGDAAGALNAAGDLANSKDMKVAAAAGSVYNALRSGDSASLIGAISSFGTTYGGGAPGGGTQTSSLGTPFAPGASTTTTGGITNRIYDETATTAAADAFIRAKNAGASDADAFDAANAATGVVVPGADNLKSILDNAKSTTGTQVASVNNGVVSDAGTGGANGLKTTTDANGVVISPVTGGETSKPIITDVTTEDTEFGDLQGAIDKNVMDDAVRADRLDQIKNMPKFSDAYAQARDLLGPNQTFEWNGKQYSTATFAENPALSGNVVPGGASTTAGAGRGSYAGYSSVEDAANKTKLSNDKTAELLNYITESQGAQYDALGNLVGGSTAAGAPDLNTTSGKIANGVANAMNTFFGVVANSPMAAVQAGSNLMSNAGGIIDLAAGKSTDLGNLLRDQSGKIDKFVASISDPDVQRQQQSIGKAVDDADGFLNKTAALANAVVSNPLGAANWVLTEAFEEVPGVGMALKAGNKIARYGITIANDMVESGGSAYNDTYKAAIAQGMPEADARAVARNASLASMAATGVTQGLVEGKLLGKVVGKETAGEFTEGSLQAGATQLALGQDLNVNKMLTQGIIEAAVGKGASTTADAVTSTNVVNNINSTVSNAVASGDAGAVSSSITNSIKSGTDAGLDAGTVITATLGTALTNGADVNTSVGSTVSSALNSDASNAQDVATDVLSAVNAVNGDVDAATDALTRSLTDAGISSDVVSNIVSTAKADASTASLISGADAKSGTNTQTATDANTGTTTQTTTDAKTGVTAQTATDTNTGVTSDTKTDAKTGVTTNTSTDANTGVTTEVKTDAKTNTQTTTTTDANTGVTSQTTVNNNTGVTTNVKTDANTNTQTTTTTDAKTGVATETNVNNNTGVTTQTKTDANTNTTTTVDANTGVNTQTTVDANTNVTINVTVNTNTNVTTETKTDPNTNTTVTTKTDLPNNVQVTTVVDDKTGEVIKEDVTRVPDDYVPPDIKITDTTKTPTTSVTPKVTTPTTPTVSLPSISSSGSGLGLMAGAALGGYDWNIKPQFLKSHVTGGAIDPLAAVKQVQQEMERESMMQNIDPRLAQILQQRMGQPQGAIDQTLGGSQEPRTPENASYTYGSEDSIDSILGDQPANYKEGGYVAPLMMNSGGSMALPLLAKSGGALDQYAGRENFKDGKHVAGKGDGQSDDIPAWLADGEYVLDAELVSALGNGSTKAGVELLDEFRRQVRAHKRGGSLNSIPPKSKSPLDYLKAAQKKVKK